MHWIARHILKSLAFADTLTYTELKPEGVEGNLFQYHARTLVRDGLIERTVTGYRLDAYGRRFVADLSASKVMRPRRQPQPMVAAVCRRGNEWLLFRWKRHPYRGQTGLVMGRHLLAHDVVAAAADQLWHKAGLRGNGRYLGQVEHIVRSGDDVSSHSLIGVVAFDSIAEPQSDGLTGDSFWSSLGAAKSSGDVLTDGFDDLITWTSDDNRLPYRLILTNKPINDII